MGGIVVKKYYGITYRILSLSLVLVMGLGILLEPLKVEAAQTPCLTPDSIKQEEKYLLGERTEIKFRMLFGSYEKETYKMNLYYNSESSSVLVATVDGDVYIDTQRERLVSESIEWDTWGYPAGSYTIEVICMYYDQDEWKIADKGMWYVRLVEHGTWVKDHVGWRFKIYDGSYPYNEWKLIDNVWYYFNSSGYMVTGWRFINGYWYYFNSSGAMVTGWICDGGTWYFLNRDGAMVTGWQYIDGYWYYFNGSGAMLANQWIGNYYVTSSGAMATNRWIGRYYVGYDGAWIGF